MVESEEIDLPVFINKLMDFFGVENFLCRLTEDKIEKKLLSLNSHKACGVDQVNSNILKACANAFSKPLKIIFKKSVLGGLCAQALEESQCNTDLNHFLYNGI